MAQEIDSQKLLIEINVKVNSLLERFDKASDGEGFSRCVNRGMRIQRLEQDVIAMKKDKAENDDIEPLKAAIAEIKKSRSEFDTWLMRITWAVIICGVVKIAFFPVGGVGI